MLSNNPKNTVGLKINDVIIRAVLLLYSIIVIFPVLWSLMTSLKSNKEFYASPWKLPSKLQWDNYYRAWTQANVSDYFLNSIIVTVVSIALTVLLASTTAYILARYEFKMKFTVTSIYLSGLMVPGALTIIPTFFLLNDLKLMNSLTGIILVYASRTLPFSILVLLGFFATIPKEMEEASVMDGCGMVRTFWTIILPMAKPGIVTVNIFNFLWYWNEFVFALTFITDPKKKTMPVGMVTLMEVAQYRTDWGALFAGLMIIMVPSVIIYMIFQSYIAEGLAAGAVKG